jgi:hypothetical protein
MAPYAIIIPISPFNLLTVSSLVLGGICKRQPSTVIVIILIHATMTIIVQVYIYSIRIINLIFMDGKNDN